MTPSPLLPPQVAPPALSLSPSRPHALAGVEVLAVPVVRHDDDLLLGPGADELSDLLDTDLIAVLEAARATAEAGEVTTLAVPAGIDGNDRLRQVLLVGLGAARPEDFRRAGAALARACRDRESVATTIAAFDPTVGLEPFVVGALLGSYGFSWRSTPPEHIPVGRVILAALTEADEAVLRRAQAVGLASWRARAMACVPSNLKNPAWMADQAVELAAEAGLGSRIWDEQQLADEGFGGIVAVAQASATPPRLIRLDYAPARASRRTPTVVLVGKGITFDSGGLSIKPGEAMAPMKRDMTGGAVVMATMAALRDVDCPLKVAALIPAAENAVSGNSLRPGDVIRHYGGRTSEVTNTDAEGRLVMADALAWAVEHIKPAVLVDVATLTGAIKVALGQQIGGLFANDDALAARLLDSGIRAGEPFWRLPLASVYEDKISSRVADADNAGSGPGAITAALFLQHFTGSIAWAHLDIASVGDSPVDSHEYSLGPTGFGVRTLLDWLGGPDPLAGIGA